MSTPCPPPATKATFGRTSAARPLPARRRSSGANATAQRCAVAHPSRRACGPPQDEVRKKGLTLRACESFDFGDSRQGSKQALTTRQIAESRIALQPLRSAEQPRASTGEARAVSGTTPKEQA